MNNLQDAFRAVQSGDKLLLHDGTYTESDNTEFSLLTDNCDLHLIGLGDHVVIKTHRDNVHEVHVGEQIPITNISLYLKNIILDMGDGFEIYDNGTVSMDNCAIVGSAKTGGSCYIDIAANGNFNAKNCRFYGDDVIGIHMSHGSRVKVIGCTFTGFKNTCIQWKPRRYSPYSGPIVLARDIEG
eukprot:361184_1